MNTFLELRAALAALASAGCLLVGLSGAVGQPDADNDPAVKAARKRQGSVKTAVIEFKRKEVIAQGGFSLRVPEHIRTQHPVPAEETTLESTNRLVLDRGKFRYEDNHPVGGPQRGTWKKMSSVELFDGATRKVFYPGGFHGPHASGHIDRAVAPDTLRSNEELIPLMLAFYGLDTVRSQYAIDKLSPRGHTLRIDEALCQEYQFTHSNQSTTSFWLDPAQDYVVRRMRSESSDGFVYQLDIRYRRHDVCGWVPVSWERNHYSPAGTALRTNTVEVMALQLNEPQPAEEFDIRFPPGAFVYDERNRTQYEVQADGSMRPLAPESRPPSRAAWFRQNKDLFVALVVIALAAIVAVVILVYVVRRRRGGGMQAGRAH